MGQAAVNQTKAINPLTRRITVVKKATKAGKRKSPVSKGPAGIPVSFSDTIQLADLEAKPDGKIAYKNIVAPLAEGIQLRASIWISKRVLEQKDFAKAIENKKYNDLLKGQKLEKREVNNSTVYKLS